MTAHDEHHHAHAHQHAHGDRSGAKQPERFDPARAARLDDPERFSYLSVEEILSLLEAPDAGCVVDFGTGTGAYAIAIARARPDLRVVALDEQPEMLALLRAKPEAARLTNLEPVGDEALPRLRHAADRVLALNVLHELGDRALEELSALLAPGGRIVFIDWDAEVERPVGPPRDHVYSAADARARIEQSGYAIVAQRRLTYHFALVAAR